MKALVTGAAGFIASHLVEYLIGKHYDVVTIDNMTAGKERNLTSGVKNYEVDIREFDKVLRVFREERPDVVFHLAAVSRTPWAIEEPLCAYSTNILGSAHILEASKIVGVKKIFLASSNIVYAAQTPYKTSKLAMEMVARDYNDLYKLPTICLRFSNVYGPRQHENNVLASLSKSKKESGKITIFGDGEQTRNFTHVLDICEAIYLAISNPEVKGIEIDACHPKIWTLNELAPYFKCTVEYTGERFGDIKELKMQGPEKAKELLGFEAKRNLEDYLNIYTEV